MKKLALSVAAALAAATSTPAAAAPATVLHALAENVDLSVCPGDQQLQAILDGNIGFDRQTITFDELEPVVLYAGQSDDRLKGQGVLLEVISGSVQVGGWGNSGGICAGHLDVSHDWDDARVRVRFVVPGTTVPRTVSSVGGFTTTEDMDGNCMQFFDAAGAALGGGCVLNAEYWPETTVEFLGAAAAAPGIAYVDITSASIPYEVDLLSFASVQPVAIDIKPGSLPNSISPGSKGNVPVAILGNAAFDATTVDRSTVLFAGVPALAKAFTPADVDGDGRLDLVVQFDTQVLTLPATATEACLTGVTTLGQEFTGCDSVRILQ